MEMDKESFDKIVEVLEDAGFSPYEYSGRGMYGRTCLAVDCDNVLRVIPELVVSMADGGSGADEIKEVVEALSDLSSDAMGHGGVAYWKGVPWAGEAEEVDEDAPEVVTKDYRREHGVSPSGEGSWAFYVNGSEEDVIWLDGKYRDVVKQAVQRAKEKGAHTLVVGS